MRIPEETIRNAAREIERAERIVLISHKNPDGDTTGAALAFYELLTLMGKSPVFYCIDPLPESFMFLPNSDMLVREFDENEFDLAIMFDVAAEHLSGIDKLKPDLFYGKYPLINIDHHPSNEGFGRWNLIDTESASVTLLLTHFFNFLGWRITPKMATCLLTGIYTDTGSLKHSNTNAEVHRVASQLLRSGARLKEIVKYIFKNTKVETLRLWGRVMKRISQTPDLITVSYVNDDDFRETETTPSDLTGAIDYLNAVPDAKFSLLLTEMNGKVKGSLRTMREDVDLTEIAGRVGGGGHKKASGFSMQGKVKMETRFTIESEGERFEDSLFVPKP